MSMHVIGALSKFGYSAKKKKDSQVPSIKGDGFQPGRTHGSRISFNDVPGIFNSILVQIEIKGFYMDKISSKWIKFIHNGSN